MGIDVCENPNCPEQSTRKCLICNDDSCEKCYQEFHQPLSCANCGKQICESRTQRWRSYQRHGEEPIIDTRPMCMTCNITTSFQV
jgi:hypothetical protein